VDVSLNYFLFLCSKKSNSNSQDSERQGQVKSNKRVTAEGKSMEETEKISNKKKRNVIRINSNFNFFVYYTSQAIYVFNGVTARFWKHVRLF